MNLLAGADAVVGLGVGMMAAATGDKRHSQCQYA
jgi:hypothetical protein